MVAEGTGSGDDTGPERTGSDEEPTDADERSSTGEEDAEGEAPPDEGGEDAEVPADTDDTVEDPGAAERARREVEGEDGEAESEPPRRSGGNTEVLEDRGGTGGDNRDDLATEPEDLIGEVLSDRYRIESVLGEGGMGVVYRAEHTHMRKTVAVKVLHPELTTVGEVVARFEREAQAAANIDHPNVCAATDFGRSANGAFYLVMEHLDGFALDEILAEQGSMKVRRAIHVARQICSALERAHDMGIVHRDLKPENVLLIERDGDPDFVKVLDFGIARVPVDDSTVKTLTRAGMVLGTPAYLSPEQATGHATDHTTDLYSLGITLFEMIAGRRPFESPSAVELLGMHATKAPPKLSKMAPAARVPLRLEKLVQRLLSDPRARWR